MSADQAHRPLSADVAAQAAPWGADPSYLYNSLRSLGPDAETVAETLGEMGFLGNHGAASCPIAKYLHAHNEVTVAATCAGTSYILFNDGEDLLLDHPEPVREFVSRFDDGDFPALEV